MLDHAGDLLVFNYFDRTCVESLVPLPVQENIQHSRISAPTAPKLEE